MEFDVPDISLPSMSEVDLQANEEDGTFVAHDLPSAEAYRAEQGVRSNNEGQKRKIVIVCGCVLSLILAAILIWLGIKIGERQRAASEAGNVIPHGESRKDTIIKLVRDLEWSNDSILDESTSEYRAAVWLADEDPLRSTISASEEFRTRYVLAVFYFATGGENWNYQLNWMSNRSYCQWNDNWEGVSKVDVTVGVICKEGTNTVHDIFLPSVGLKGALPQEIHWLNGLRSLDLYNNDIVALPSTMESMIEMRKLVLHNNHIGLIPAWLDSWPELETLDMANNGIKGSIPSFIKNLPKLLDLNLERNELTGDIGLLTGTGRLRFLALGGNSISGKLTKETILSWPDLEQLDLSDNTISGSLPKEVFQLALLEVLDLHGNDFDGKLEFAVNEKLEFLALHHNSFNDSISPEIAELRSLRHLDLSTNQLSGDIPYVVFQAMDTLTYLYLAYNPFTEGPLSPSLPLNLRELSLQKTGRIGQIPTEMGLLKNLVLLDLAKNGLQGPLPEELGTDMKQLAYLLLNDNFLLGEIPQSFSGLTSLDTFVIKGNSITGGMQNVCSLKGNVLDELVSDCEETKCSCCSLCCKDGGDEVCDIREWFDELDPVSGYLYKRVNYKFGEDDVVYPIPAQQDFVDHFNTFGNVYGDDMNEEP